MQAHMAGRTGTLPDVWVGETAKLVFLPTGQDGARWSQPVNPRFDVMTRCMDLGIAYTVEESEGRYTLIPQPPQWEVTTEPRCTDAERETLESLGKRLATLDTKGLNGDVLDFGAGLTFIRTQPSEALSDLHTSLILEPGHVWTPSEPPKFSRGAPITMSYGAGMVGGFDGCNGWGADYHLVDGWAGPREYRRGFRSTTVYCGDLYDTPESDTPTHFPLPGERWIEVVDGELLMQPASPGSRYIAVNAEELQRDYTTRARAAQREQILEGLRLAPGESWIYDSSDLEHFSNAAGAMRTTTFTTLNSASVTGTDGCNRFEGGRAILSEREGGWGFDLQGDLISTEIYCPNVLPILGHIFAPDTTINVHDGSLTFVRTSTMVTFRKAAAVN